MDAATLKTLVRASYHGDVAARQAIESATGLVWDEKFRLFLPPGT